MDSSALVKRYVMEPGREAAETILLRDPEWVTANHAYTEVRLALARRLADDHLSAARRDFELDWERTYVVEIDDRLCRRAAEIGEQTAARALDALHLAAHDLIGGAAIPLLTFDVRMAMVARGLGLTVLGA